MKNINKILIILSLGFIILYGADSNLPNILENQDESTMYGNNLDEPTTINTESAEVISEQTEVLGVQEETEMVQNTPENTGDAVDTQKAEFQEELDLAASGAEDNGNIYPNPYDDIAIVEDVNETMEVSEDMSEFEKLFVNHSAYIYYLKGIEELQIANYKAAYENAMKAKAIIDNTNKPNEQVIALPYMPNYVRESSYTPKRIYYKTVKAKPYELKRLITKAKLISPPIASVVLKRTSTYIEVITRNYGDLPLDEFELLVNEDSIVKYEKILPNEQKITRIGVAPNLFEISFKEKYGFAPKSIMLSEGE